MIRPLVLVGALALLAGCASEPPSSMTQSGMAMSAGDYVTAAAEADQFEIQEGQLAATRAQGPKLRDFGQMMVRDHTATSQALAAAAARSGLGAPPTALRSEQQQMLDKLQAAKGADFDRLYLSQQVQAHQEALSLQTAYADGGADSNLKSAAIAAVPVIRRHLDLVRQLSTSPGGS